MPTSSSTDPAIDPSDAGSPSPLLLDADGLREIATDLIVERGIRYFEEHRVTDLVVNGTHLFAAVEGSRPDLPYQVQIEAAADGWLDVACDCPFDWEPVCKHAVAALVAWAHDHDLEGLRLVQNAAEEAIAERVRTAKTGVVVEHQHGEPDFGTWRARSIKPTGGIARSYAVQIRSRTDRLNTCTCPDFRTNQLGTCKHIEAVLHKLARRRSGKGKAARGGPPMPVVYLAWDVADAPQVRVRVPAAADGRCRAFLADHFDERGVLRGALPDALRHLDQAAAGQVDIDIGADARGHAERIGTTAAHRERAREIHDEIRRSGGQLPGIRAHLYPYQVEGVAFLAANRRALLADDMGLGKTLQTIAAAVWLMKHEGVERVMVVCPASLKQQWAREIEKFSGIASQIVGGGPNARLAQYRQRAPFTLINYELVMRDHEVIQRELAPDVLVLDEAQRIKNWRTRTAAVVKRLHTRYAFVLSGTPLENRLEDLYSVMQVVDPQLLGPLWRFLIDFHVTDPSGKVVGYRNLSELRRRLSGAVLRRDRRLVADQLPERVHHRRDVPLTPRQREFHDGALQSVGILYQRAKAQRRPLTPGEENRIMALLQTARMACNAAGLVDKETVGSPKLSELEGLLDEVCVQGGEKVVVFSQWERMTAMAEEVAHGLGLGTVRLHGGVPTKQRGALIDRFEQEPDVQVFLSTDAGGTGLNLQTASALINLDLPWNPAVLEQRIARVHRLGQRRTVQVFLLIAAGSYEQDVSRIMGGKRALFGAVVAGESDADTVGLSRRSVEVAMQLLEGRAAGGGEGVADDDAPSEIDDGAPSDGLPADGTDDGALAGGTDEGALVDGADASVEPSAGTIDRDEEAAEDHDAAEADDADASLAPVIAELQRALGSRLARVMVTGAGLVAVVQHSGDDDEQLGASLSTFLPVAILDEPTVRARARFGAASPLAEARELSAPAAPAAIHPLETAARRKLGAAEELIARDCGPEALRLLADAMLAALARRAGRSDMPTPDGAVAWLYGEVVPGGFATAEDAAAVLRADGLSRGHAVPAALVDEALGDARRLVLGT